MGSKTSPPAAMAAVSRAAVHDRAQHFVWAGRLAEQVSGPHAIVLAACVAAVVRSLHGLPALAAVHIQQHDVSLHDKVQVSCATLPHIMC